MFWNTPACTDPQLRNHNKAHMCTFTDTHVFLMQRFVACGLTPSAFPPAVSRPSCGAAPRCGFCPGRPLPGAAPPQEADSIMCGIANMMPGGHPFPALVKRNEGPWMLMLNCNVVLRCDRSACSKGSHPILPSLLWSLTPVVQNS